MLNKVMKKMQELEKLNNPSSKSKVQDNTTNRTYPTSRMSKGKGFDAKKSSDKGAQRARSIGNRNRKPSSSK